MIVIHESRPRRTFLLAWSCIVLVSVVLHACGDASAEPGTTRSRDGASGPYGASLQEAGKSGERSENPDALLSRAIAALGGQQRLAALKGVESAFRASSPGFAMKGRIREEFPERFRMEMEVWDATVVHVSDGEDAWKTIDGVRVPIEKEDRRQLEEQIFMARMSLLVGLRGNEDIRLRSLGRQDGFDWLEVEPKSRDLGPYRLGFDAGTSLLTLTRYETFVYGHSDRMPVTLRLSDYRPVSGVMVPFSSCTTVEGETDERTIKVTEIRFDPPGDPSLFAKPDLVQVASIQRRVAVGFRVLALDGWGGKSADACNLLDDAIQKCSLSRTGPAHLFYKDTDRSICSVAYPIMSSAVVASSRPTLEERFAFREVPACDVLTTVVRKPSPELLKAAELRLVKEARKKMMTPTGALRTVVWREDIVQIQLPVK